ncbi:Holliday junction branch migration DNA helicase RuvB [bacterium]|nr:Holliday junction branch migration DNA helicase RuvB [candidate division CSSED10-310 bacterium]
MIEDQRHLISPNRKEDDDRHWESIRPRTLEEYIGQNKIKMQLKIFLQAVNQRNEALDHVLFYGPPGLGKTTLALILGRELGVRVESTSGPALEHPGDIAAILTNLERRDILFIDEIHRLNRVVEEKLYPAMEDYRMDLVMGQGPAARVLPLELSPFTLVGATTRFGAISSPMRDRFGIICRLQFYSPGELIAVLNRSAGIMGISLLPEGAAEIAGRARGTPRIANRLLKRVRDFAQVQGNGQVTGKIADRALTEMEIDGEGLDSMDRSLLIVLAENYGGGPVGIETLAAALSEDKDTIEDVYEPFLIQQGFLQRTPRGRVLTPKSYDHLHMSLPESMKSSELPF